MFADADDFYNKNAFSILDNYINSDNDVIYFFANSLDVNTLLPTPREKDLQNIYENMILIILEVQIIFDLKIGLHGIK